MRRLLRVVFSVVCAGLVVWGIVRERHVVHQLGGGEAQAITGGGFVEGAAVDSYLLRDGKLFDVYRLTGATAGEKDCKT